MRIQNKIMLGAVIFVLCAAAAYAQVGVSSIPVTTVRNTGRAELAGAVQLTAGGATVADTFTIRYGVPITNGTTTGIAIDAASTWPGCAIAALGVDNVNGIVTITCGAAAAGQFFKITGVRVSVDGFAGSQILATIGALFTPITAGQSSAVVIESVAPGLKLAFGNSVQSFLANSFTATGTGKVFYQEGFASAFRTITDEGGAITGATGPTTILLTLAGLPAGYTVTASFGAGTSPTLTAALSGATFTSTTTQRTITITAENVAILETLEVDFTLGFGFTVALPLNPASFAVTATLYPNDAALSIFGGVVVPFNAPKFAVSNVPSDAGQTIITIIPASTSFVIPYATTALGYDTGIAIANTTSDPFGAFTGGATKQNGTITFNFYPNDGTTIAPYTTKAGSPGSGLTAAGVLNSGSTYVVLLSQVLTAAGRTTAFTGYIIPIVNANECHGVAFVSDFTGKFTSFAPMLIIPNPAVAGFARSGLANELLMQ
jgi:hypothetical protein